MFKDQTLAPAELARRRYLERKALHVSQHFGKITDYSAEQLARVVRCGLDIKQERLQPGHPLKGKLVGLIFQKTSTRTRCSFERAIQFLGGQSSYISWQDSNFVLSDLEDEARVLSKYYDLIVSRTFSTKTYEVLAANSDVPLINGLCDNHHPCQAVSDMVSLVEYFGKIAGLNVAYVGDGNNVCRSLVEALTLLGARTRIYTPQGYQLDSEVLSWAGDSVELVNNMHDAVKGVDVVYTDTWVSMGQEAETNKRRLDFEGFQVNSEVLQDAADHAIFMHCLPAHPDFEVSSELLRGPRSIVFDQAANRIFGQIGILLEMFAV